MNSNFRIEFDRNDKEQLVKLHGNLDASCESFLTDVPKMLSQQKVRFDFTNTGRINSMGIALLLKCFKEIKNSNRSELFISGLNPMNLMLFKMTGVFLLASPSQPQQLFRGEQC